MIWQQRASSLISKGMDCTVMHWDIMKSCNDLAAARELAHLTDGTAHRVDVAADAVELGTHLEM